MVDSDLSLPCWEGHELSQSRPRDYFCSFEKSVFCFRFYFNFSFWQNVCFVYLLFNFRENVQKARVILNESRLIIITALVSPPLTLSFRLFLCRYCLFVGGFVRVCVCVRRCVCVCLCFQLFMPVPKSILSWRFLGIKSTHFCPSGI